MWNGPLPSRVLSPYFPRVENYRMAVLLRKGPGRASQVQRAPRADLSSPLTRRRSPRAPLSFLLPVCVVLPSPTALTTACSLPKLLCSHPFTPPSHRHLVRVYYVQLLRRALCAHPCALLDGDSPKDQRGQSRNCLLHFCATQSTGHLVGSQGMLAKFRGNM